MRVRRLSWQLSLVGMALMGANAPITAASASPGTCQVSLSSLAFGPYEPLNPRPIDSGGTLTVTCTGMGPGPLDLTLAAISPDRDARRLTHAEHSLAYTLYKDAARQQVWGDGTAGATPIMVRMDDPSAPLRIAFYGRIAARQNAAPADYHDAILVMLSY